MMYFDVVERAFIDTRDYGERTLNIPDPAWSDVGPAPLVTIDNPACRLPPASQLVPLTDEAYVALKAGHSNGKLIDVSNGLPVLVDPPPKSPQEVFAINLRRRDALLEQAATRIAPLQDAVDLDEATTQEAAELKAWKQYRITLNRLDLSPFDIAWPALPS